MAKRFPFVESFKELAKHLQPATTSRIATVSSNRVCFSTYVRGGDPVTGPAETGDDRANPGINVDYKIKGGTKKDNGEQGGVTGFMADAAKQGTVKGTQVLESFGDAANETVDTAWDAAKRTTQKVGATITAVADTNVVDTVEYRSTEDLMGQLGDGHYKQIEF